MPNYDINDLREVLGKAADIIRGSKNVSGDILGENILDELKGSKFISYYFNVPTAGIYAVGAHIYNCPSSSETSVDTKDYFRNILKCLAEAQTKGRTTVPFGTIINQIVAAPQGISTDSTHIANIPAIFVDSSGNEHDITMLFDNIFKDDGDLVGIIFPPELKKIGISAFEDTSSLTNLTLPEYLEEIGIYAFRRCGISSITIPGDVIVVGNGAFCECDNLTSVIWSSEAGISDSCFQGCTSLSQINIREDVEVIGSYAFEGCEELQYISLPAALTTIGNSAFKGTALTSITIPRTVTSVAADAFNNTEEASDYLSSATIYYDGTIDGIKDDTTYKDNVLFAFYCANENMNLAIICNDETWSTTAAEAYNGGGGGSGSGSGSGSGNGDANSEEEPGEDYYE